MTPVSLLNDGLMRRIIPPFSYLPNDHIARDCLDAAGSLLVQGGRTRIACTLETAGLASHAPRPMAELIFIGYHLNRDRVVATLTEHTGTTWY